MTGAPATFTPLATGGSVDGRHADVGINVEAEGP